MNTQPLSTDMFKSGHVLYAEQLNTLVKKINSIINDVASIDTTPTTTTGGGVTASEVDQKINKAVNDLNKLIDDAKTNLDLRISFIEDSDPQNVNRKTDKEWIELFKDVLKGSDGRELMNAVLFEMGVCNSDGVPYFDATVMQKIDGTEERVSSLEMLPDQISLLVERKQDGSYAVKPGAIIAAITEDGTGMLKSSIGLSADNITLDGDTFANSLSTKILEATNGTFGSMMTNGNGTFKGNVEATSFKVMKDTTNPSVIFTTMSDEYRGTGFENLNSSGIANGEPIGLVFDPQTNTPKYFFDFAPVGNSNFSAEPTMFYNITGAASNITVSVANTYYYVTNSEDINYQHYIVSPRSNGTRVSNKTCYEYYDSQTAFLSRAQGGHYIVKCYLYREVSFDQYGNKNYTGKVRLLSSNALGSNITSYVPQSTATVYKDQIYSGNTQTTINLSSASYSGRYVLNVGVSNDVFTENETNPFTVGVIESHSFGTLIGIENRNLLDPNLHMYQSA